MNKDAIIDAWNESICLDDILADMLEAVKDNAEPDDVFDSGQLETWAENNGYVKAE